MDRYCGADSQWATESPSQAASHRKRLPCPPVPDEQLFQDLALRVVRRAEDADNVAQNLDELRRDIDRGVPHGRVKGRPGRERVWLEGREGQKVVPVHRAAVGTLGRAVRPKGQLAGELAFEHITHSFSATTSRSCCGSSVKSAIPPGIPA